MNTLLKTPGKYLFVLLFSSLLINSALMGQTTLSGPIRFQNQDPKASYTDEAQPVQLSDGRVMMVYTSHDSIFCSLSTNGGISWDNPSFITLFSRPNKSITAVFSACVTETHRVIVIYSPSNKTSYSAQALKITYSDDNGSTWSSPQNVYSSMSIVYPSIMKGPGNKLWISGRSNNLFVSTDNGFTWNPKTTNFTARSMAALKDNSLLAFSEASDLGNKVIQLRRSTDDGQSWSNPSTISASSAAAEDRPLGLTTSDGTLWVVYQVSKLTAFTGLNQYDIYYKKSTDNGTSWSQAVQLTKYAGNDFDVNVTSYNAKPFISFISGRYFNASFQNGLTPYGIQIWLASIDNLNDDNAPAAIFNSSTTTPAWNVPTHLTINAASHSGISSAAITYKLNSQAPQFVQMYDDGRHNDESANDNIWGGDLPAMKGSDQITYGFKITDKNNNVTYFYGGSFINPFHKASKWLTAGSLQDWYSSIAGEREEGILDPQTNNYSIQTGWQWPADHKFMDSKAWTSLWLGAKNFTDKNGTKFDNKVVHVGPRVTGTGEFFPIQFYLKSKYPKPVVTVNGKGSYSLNDTEIDTVDPNMAADREIVNVCNTQLGLTVTRRIFQFSQAYHDNYIVQEYTLTNTGDTDGDTSTIELPNQTLEGVMMFSLARIAPVAYSRYVIGNSTGWGMNTTIDTRGDGLKPDPAGENFRAQFAWHGKFPAFTQYDNIGGPIWTVQTNVTKGDTIGRLAAFQFAGYATLHADRSASDKSDDQAQPATTSTFDSDGPLMSSNDAMNTIKMASEYQFMTQGHDKRHLDKIGETNIIMPTKDPSLGTGGGYSFGNGYGPYTLKHGESVKIVLCQASAGMGWEAGEKVGIYFKAGKITVLQKNTEIFKGKDSLFTTFRRAMNNYNSGWKLPSPPAHPKSFSVNGYDKGIKLSWTLFNESDPDVQGFQIFRASGKRDSAYSMIAELNSSARSFNDTLTSKGVDYYYNIRAIGKSIADDPSLNISSVRLTSSKFFTQTYDPVSAGTTGINDGTITPGEYKLFNNYPNPFNPVTVIKYSIPSESKVRISVFNLLGEKVSELVNEIKKPGTYQVQFNAEGLASGIYFYSIEAASNGREGFVSSKKMALIK